MTLKLAFIRSASAEYFLSKGYAVIFMHRTFSLQPFSRHFSHSKNCFLDYMSLSPSNDVQVNPNWALEMKPKLETYTKVKTENTLLTIHFTSVSEYLYLLKEVSAALSEKKREACIYLAAAVSDFFIPSNKMVQHKIQSSDHDGFTLSMDKVPKAIGPLVKFWAKEAFVVSFKLETDEDLLIPKARGSLEKYGHALVIGNILNTRKEVVTFVTANQAVELRQAGELEIESDIIDKLVDLHCTWISKNTLQL